MDMRRSGRSTRIIDKCVQKLFTEGEVVVIDHFPAPMGHRHLFDRFLKRLENEHFRGVKSMEYNLLIDRKNFVVRIKNFKG